MAELRSRPFPDMAPFLGTRDPPLDALAQKIDRGFREIEARVLRAELSQLIRQPLTIIARGREAYCNDFDFRVGADGHGVVWPPDLHRAVLHTAAAPYAPLIRALALDEGERAVRAATAKQDAGDEDHVALARAFRALDRLTQAAQRYFGSPVIKESRADFQPLPRVLPDRRDPHASVASTPRPEPSFHGVRCQDLIGEIRLLATKLFTGINRVLMHDDVGIAEACGLVPIEPLFEALGGIASKLQTWEHGATLFHKVIRPLTLAFSHSGDPDLDECVDQTCLILDGVVLRFQQEPSQEDVPDDAPSFERLLRAIGFDDVGRALRGLEEGSASPQEAAALIRARADFLAFMTDCYNARGLGFDQFTDIVIRAGVLSAPPLAPAELDRSQIPF